MIIRTALVAAAAMLSTAAWAQPAEPHGAAALLVAQATAPAAGNPLQPRVVRPAPAPATAPVTAPATAPARAAAPAQAAPGEAKPARQRSAAQLANDDRMRKCGAEWRAGKASLSAQGKTWRVFNVECRARLKAAGQ